MAPAIWKDSLELGIAIVDTQHKELAELSCEYIKAIAEGESAEVCEGLLSQIRHKAEKHFAYEESLMRKANFPGMDDHVRQHMMLSHQLLAHGRFIRSRSSAKHEELSHFFNSWLNQHLLEYDAKLAEFLKENDRTD